MIDIFIGRPPSTNRHQESSNPPVQQEVRELLRIFKNIQSERRKNTKDRRRRANPDVIVNLPHRRERRTQLDRRQKQEFLLNTKTKKERRNPKPDRRKSANDGVIVSLSTRPDRRKAIERRTIQSGKGSSTQQKTPETEEIKDCIESMQKLIERLQKYI